MVVVLLDLGVGGGGWGDMLVILSDDFVGE